MTSDINIDFGFRLSSDIILAVLIRIVRLIRSEFIFFQFGNFSVDIILVPSAVVIFDSGCVSNQVDWFLSTFILLLWDLLLLFGDLLLQMFLDLFLLGSLLLEYLVFCFLFQLHLLLPIVEV